MAVDAAPSAHSPFEAWQRARHALKAAEDNGADYAEILRLSAQVISTRNLVTLDRMDAGWEPADHILKHLIVDDQLLREHDDAT